MDADIIKKPNYLVSPSEQNILDYKHQRNGCGGGLEIEAFKDTRNPGIIPEKGQYNFGLLLAAFSKKAF